MKKTAFILLFFISILALSCTGKNRDDEGNYKHFPDLRAEEFLFAFRSLDFKIVENKSIEDEYPYGYEESAQYYFDMFPNEYYSLEEEQEILNSKEFQKRSINEGEDEKENSKENEILFEGSFGNLLNSGKVSVLVTDELRIKRIDVNYSYMNYGESVRERIEEGFLEVAAMPYSRKMDMDTIKSWVRENAHTHGAKEKIEGIWFSIERDRTSTELCISVTESEIVPLDEYEIARIKDQDDFVEAEKLAGDGTPNVAGKIIVELIDSNGKISGEGLPELEERYIYFALKSRITNNTDETVKLNGFWMFISNDDNIYMTTSDVSNLIKPALDGYVRSGESKEGWVTFKTRPSAMQRYSHFDLTGSLKPILPK